MRAINLKTNHLTEPVGIDAGVLFLSWQCADGVRQTAYAIELTANGETVWHSGKVQSTAMEAGAQEQPELSLRSGKAEGSPFCHAAAGSLSE